MENAQDERTAENIFSIARRVGDFRIDDVRFTFHVLRFVCCLIHPSRPWLRLRGNTSGWGDPWRCPSGGGTVNPTEAQ